MSSSTNTNIVFDEICSVQQIFDYKITPDVTKLNLENHYINDVIVEIKYPYERNEESSEAGVFSLNLNLKLTDKYPHDLPVLHISNVVGLSNIDLEVLTNNLINITQSLCGKFMLMELILYIDDYISSVYSSTIRAKPLMLVEDDLDIQMLQSNASAKKNVSPSIKKDRNNLLLNFRNDHDIGKHFCINTVLNTKNCVDLISEQNSKLTQYQLIPCEAHHCGICHFSGVKCTENFDSFNFRAWKFSESCDFCPETNPQIHLKSVELALLKICESINHSNELNHVKIDTRSKAFVYKTLKEFYLFIGTPISCVASISLCNYFEGLLVKVTERTIHSFITQILQGLQYLHSNSVIHGSLYPCSILVRSDLNIILRDIGCIPKIWDLWLKTQQIGKRMRAHIKTHHFTKYTSFAKYNYKGDIFFFGLIVLSFCDSKIYNKFPIKIPHIFNSKFVDFIRSCVSYVESHRSTATELLKHPYITLYQPSDSIWVGMNTDGQDIEFGLKSSNVKSISGKDAESRLLNEFDLLSVLGKGAFGVVILARNRIDRCIYAVKRITLNERNMSEKNRILREIKFLSRLNHANIVRYYNSWIEYHEIKWFSDNVQPNSDNEMDESSLSSFSKKNSFAEPLLGQAFNSNDQEDITFVDSENERSYSQNSSSSPEDSSDSTIIVDKNNGTRVFLYMQMEYCEKKTLRDVIDNENLYRVDDRLWRFFRDICEGLSYIHSQGMVHRDIKPENILISAIDHAKIVDFNLAMVSVQRDHLQRNVSLPDYSAETTHKYISSYGSSVYAGTFPYTAPELNFLSTKHDNNIPITSKIDMYSFGIVFFEMCHPPFYTKSERHSVIHKLKSEFSIPKIYDPNKITILKGLLEENYLTRLSADDLLLTNLYPIALKDTNFDKVIQYILTDPVSLQSRKLLNSFFIHEQNTDVVGNFNSKFFNKPPYDLLSNSFDRSCCLSYIRKYFSSLGCIDLQTPTFHRYINKNIYDALTNVTYVDSRGTRLYLEPYTLLSIFKVISNSCPVDLQQLPILRFGGMNTCYKCDNSSTNEHPVQSFECYFGIVCVNNDHIVNLIECISETAELLKICQAISLKLKGETLRIHENIQDLTDKYELVDSIEININHYCLLTNILLCFGISNEESILLLNKLSKNHPLESLISESSSIKRKKQQIINILQYKGNINQFIELLITSITITESLKKILDYMKILFDKLSIFSNWEFNININPSLYNCDIWPADSFIFQIVGLINISTKQDVRSSKIILANGGLYNYRLKHSRFFSGNIKELSYKQNEFDPLNSKDNRIAYCSISGYRLLSIFQIMHLNRSCVNNDTVLSPSIHESVIMCYLNEEDDETEHDIYKLHSISSKLRQSSGLSVYTYNFPLTLICIRELREKLHPLSILAIISVRAQDLSVRIFFIDKNKNEEIVLNDPSKIYDSLLRYQYKIKNPFTPSSLPPSQYNSTNIKQIIKDENTKEIKFLFDQATILSSLERKYSTSVRYAINSYTSLFSNSSKFIALIADICSEEFNEIVNELPLTSYQVESTLTTFLRKSTSSNIQRVVKLIIDNLSDRSPDTIYFLYSPLISKIRPLL